MNEPIYHDDKMIGSVFPKTFMDVSGWSAMDGYPHKAIIVFETRDEAVAYLIERYEHRKTEAA